MATRPRDDRQRLTLGVAAPWLRGTIGPVAWAVLEVVAERSDPREEGTVSCSSVRGLATELHLANDTVARALRRLAQAGLLHYAADRDATGRFGSGRYVLTLPPNVFDLATDLAHPSRSKPAAKTAVQFSSGEQLALLPEA